MFERPHHRRIARVLSALDGELLREANWLTICLASRVVVTELKFTYTKLIQPTIIRLPLDARRPTEPY